jgi:L-ascorbate metabolism protein UlaG (beta-lactamase superfamily)
MQITWFGHSCFRIETGKSVILIDPFLTGNPTFQASGIDKATAIRGVTHVALTHGHGDHVGDAGDICKTTGATLFATYELAQYVGKQGASKLEPMNTGGTVCGPDFGLTLTDALHSSASPDGVYLGNPNGIVITPTTGPAVYHMGDTDIFPGMQLVNDLYAPKIGLVPIGDRFTMGAKAAALACQRFFKFNMVIPCHFGTFPGMLAPNADAFVAAMAGHRVVVPKVGEAVAA